ncbi:D-glycero-beta-D-manno-heptose 1,7-bisphosphate 7-phosphatase [Larsenimonas rhizosphaerae]|uniref:D-glycero-beta-D-manno-heptose 1,7-bisphosphate 7-phosphatase n=1 Tax=Larsenimonas rhizosphaerae TaxID=2944682 RepID=UPI00203456AA|nr:D-glycero-beta-D-manno-heptose 1,7-bisphosphate 7-phosphatase [Larsenimonas rhizosphaerae]MCM2129307.1 D-glycero-beta-D-manno-heptose 1,7-bisphosphate 7-phosphatase [Larsenimonas rhizosphaerae]
MHSLIILDRDGVINEDSPHYIKSVDEWIPIPGAIEAIAALYNAGYTIAVATNQSGIARQLFDEATLAAMHSKMCSLVEKAGGHISHIAWCPHGPKDNCHCRKPSPGLLESIRDTLGYQDLKSSWMVGDSLRDLQAGDRVGCRLALVRTGKGEKTSHELAALSHPDSVIVSESLAEFAARLLDCHADTP